MATVAKAKAPAPKTGSSDDLIPRSMLPDSSVIPEWRQFGYGAEGPAVPKPAPKKPGGRAAGGHIKKMAGGGNVPGRKSKGSGSMQPMPKPHEQHFRDEIRTPVIPDPVKYPEYIEEVGEERVSGPRMRKGGMARSSASKRADGCAVRGKTRGKMV